MLCLHHQAVMPRLVSKHPITQIINLLLQLLCVQQQVLSAYFMSMSGHVNLMATAMHMIHMISVVSQALAPLLLLARISSST